MKSCGFHFNTTYTGLPQPFFTEQNPTAVASPKMVIINDDLAQLMGLNFTDLSDKKRAELFSGNRLPEGATPFAQAYAGHQFGYFTILGDGRAVVWGEHITPQQQRVDIQFKGSGQTPYSRRGDGKAALGPMLREYIISEAMHYLGIPTTRSLAVVTTGESVRREQRLPGAILTRVACSHIRIGTFEFAAERGGKPLISAIMNYTIDRHYPELRESQNPALDLIQVVMEKQIDLIVHWMRVGFIHGVMNTDNMLLSGESIDYGPCAFMDFYDPATVFSSIDHEGRYAYANQPMIAQWNLARLAEALLPIIHDDAQKAVESAEKIISQFPDIYKHKWLAMMSSKLGLFELWPEDEQLISRLLAWMQSTEADYTNTFRDLSQAAKPEGKLYRQEAFRGWYKSWQDRLKKNPKSLESSSSLMKTTNPAVIPRNHKVEEVLKAAHNGCFKPLHELLAVLKEPYKDRDCLKPFQNPPEPSECIHQTFCGT